MTPLTFLLLLLTLCFTANGGPIVSKPHLVNLELNFLNKRAITVSCFLGCVFPTCNFKFNCSRSAGIERARRILREKG